MSDQKGGDPASNDPGDNEAAAEGPTVVSYSHWQHVVVSVDDQHLDDIQGVASQLRDRGMQIDQILDGLGMITGSVPDEERSQSVVQVVGVASVERQVTHQLPPPDAEVQ